MFSFFPYACACKARRRARARATSACLLILLLLVAPAAGAAAQSPLSLDEAIRMAVERAPMLDARRAQVEAARQESPRAGALPDPMLTDGIDHLPVPGPAAFDTAPHPLPTH